VRDEQHERWWDHDPPAAVVLAIALVLLVTGVGLAYLITRSLF
jgi:hypothetical protein